MGLVINRANIYGIEVKNRNLRLLASDAQPNVR